MGFWSWWPGSRRAARSPPGGDAAKDPSTREIKFFDRLTTKYGLASGACCSPDSPVSAGWASLRGKRSTNEDTVFCEFRTHKENGSDAGQPGTSVGCFGVFDGHGGPSAARFVCDNLFTNLIKNELFASNLVKAVADAYTETDGQYIELDAELQRDDGCTAVTAVLVGNRLVVAHCGDSRAVMSVGHKAMALSKDHKPNRDDERDRKSTVLAVSRSFGNRMMKEFIIPHPEIREDTLTSKNQCLVLASDGLWDAMNNDETTRLALEHRRRGPEAAARAIVAEAYNRGSQDNITAVVVFFSYDGPSGSGRSSRASDHNVGMSR